MEARATKQADCLLYDLDVFLKASFFYAESGKFGFSMLMVSEYGKVDENAEKS